MSIFPTKILLATDGSRDAELAARTALALAELTNSELDVVHVGPVTLIPYYPSIPEGTEPARVEREAEKLLNEQMQRIKAAGGSGAHSHLRIGGADEEIVALGEEIGAGLIVVGSRGRSSLKRALMGSVSDSVVRHAHCPVLVVRGEENEEPIVSSKRILLATDGSEEAQLASRMAMELAGATGSELHLITVGSEYHPGVETTLDPELLEETRDELERAARELLDEQVKKIKESGGSITEAHLKMGGVPDQQIVVLGEEIGAGLIVMGSRGLGGMRRALMGSVSESVVRHAHCPVLVVRREE